MKSIAYAIVTSTALVLVCFAPKFGDQCFALFVYVVFGGSLLMRREESTEQGGKL